MDDFEIPIGKVPSLLKLFIRGNWTAEVKFTDNEGKDIFCMTGTTKVVTQ